MFFTLKRFFGLLVVLGFLFNFLAWAEPDNSVLSEVTVNEIGTKTRVNLNLSKKVEYSSKEMKTPRRTVLTFKEKTLCKDKEPLTFNTGTVKTVRFLTLKNEAAEAQGLFLLDSIIIEYTAEVKEEIFFQDAQLMVDSEVQTAEATVEKPAEQSVKTEGGEDLSHK